MNASIALFATLVNNECYSFLGEEEDGMVQVKKTEVKDAILDSAYKLFMKKGYARTTTAQIAAGARVSEANLYVYFKSKLEILFGIYEPWLRERINDLEKRIAAARTPRTRLKLLLTTLWRELPSADNGFTNNLMQALSTSERGEGYDPALLNWVEQRLEQFIVDVLPPEHAAAVRRGRLVHVLMMAQDGFAMAYHLNPDNPCGNAAIELMCDFILGSAAAADQQGGAAAKPARAAVSKVARRKSEVSSA